MRTILIRQNASDADLVRTIGDLAANVGKGIGGTATYKGSFQHSPETTVHVWEITGQGKTEIRLVFDQIARATYLSVESDELGLESQIFEEFSRQLSKIPVAELLDDVSRNGANDSQAYVRLALGSGGEFSGEYSEEVHKVLSDSLRSQELNRRRGAALAMGLLLWPEFWDDIVEALETETDQANRSLLTVAYRQLAA